VDTPGGLVLFAPRKGHVPVVWHVASNVVLVPLLSIAMADILFEP